MLHTSHQLFDVQNTLVVLMACFKSLSNRVLGVLSCMVEWRIFVLIQPFFFKKKKKICSLIIELTIGMCLTEAIIFLPDPQFYFSVCSLVKQVSDERYFLIGF